MTAARPTYKLTTEGIKTDVDGTLLSKVGTANKVLENPEISRTIRRYDASITEVNPTYTIVMKHGVTEQIISLYRALDEFGCVFQYTRSGRIAVTRGKQEEVSKFLEQREEMNG